jgi:hypothetical protein
LLVQLGRNMATNVNHLGFLGFIVHGFTQIGWKANETISSNLSRRKYQNKKAMQI